VSVSSRFVVISPARNRIRVAGLLIACLLLFHQASFSQAGNDRIAWMASRLLSGKGILDYELAAGRFVAFPDPRVLPTLIKMTQGENDTARAAAAGVLWRYNNDESRKRLLDLIQDASPPVRVEAAKSLCLMKYTANLPIVSKELLAKDHQVRARALRALTEVGTEAARGAIESFKTPASPLDQVWVAYSRYRLGIDPQGQLGVLTKRLLEVPETAWLLNRRDPVSADLEWAAKQGEKGVAIRLEAAAALSRIGDEKALALLVDATGDLALAAKPTGPRKLLRRHGDQAVLALARGLGSPRVLVRLGSSIVARHMRLRASAAREALSHGLQKCLVDESRLVRLAAMRAIPALGLRDHVDALVKNLGHSDDPTRSAAARALGRLADSRAVQPLIGRLGKEKNPSVIRDIYRSLKDIGSSSAVDPLMKRLSRLHEDSRSSEQAADEMRPCIQAIAAGGDSAAKQALALLDRAKGERRRLLTEVLANSGSTLGLDFFLDRLRENPPDPDGPEVRFFDSLDKGMAPKLEEMITDESAMWIRVILARALVKMGKREYARGIIWGLRNEDAYMKMLAAALSAGIKIPGSVEPLTRLLTDKPRTARFAARALLEDGSAKAVSGVLNGLSSSSFRRRTPLPLTPFWEGHHSATHPFAKEVDNERVWVLFAENRIGRNMDLFITWSIDGRIWKEPAFTGLTSFSDKGLGVAPPTFSLKVRGRDITIALTRTFAQSASFEHPSFKTLQRVHRFKLQDFFRDHDSDGLADLEEKAFFTNPQNRDTDRDGIPDGQDKNPLAPPADVNKDQDVLKALAFSHAYLTKDLFPRQAQLLIVRQIPGRRNTPELAVFPGLVLHLNKEQIRGIWKSTGGGFPQIQFEPALIRNDSATQIFTVFKGINDEERYEAVFEKTDGQWILVRFES